MGPLLDLQRAQATLTLAAAVQDSAFALQRVLNDEIEHWNRLGWPCEKARMWARLEWWVTWEDVQQMAQWLLGCRSLTLWTPAETAAVVVAMLEGWEQRQQVRA